MFIKPITILIISDYMDFHEYTKISSLCKYIRKYVKMYLRHKYPKKILNLIHSQLPPRINACVPIVMGLYGKYKVDRDLSPILYIIITGDTTSRVTRLVSNSIEYEYSDNINAYVPVTIHGCTIYRSNVNHHIKLSDGMLIRVII